MDDKDLKSQLDGLFSDVEPSGIESQGLPSGEGLTPSASYKAFGRQPSEAEESQLAEEALRESESRLRTILDNVQAGVLILDPETHTIVDVNPVAAKLIGAPKEQIVGAVCHKYVCPADKGKCPITDLDQRVDNSERILLTADGGKRPIIKTVVTVMLGGREHLLESFVDITERKQTEEALREAELKYRTLVEQMPTVIYMDAIDEVSSTIYMSPQVQVLSGYSPDEWKADPELWAKLLHPDDRSRVLAENARTNTTGEPFKLEYRLIARDGRTVWVRDEAVIVRDSAGRPRFWQGVMLDITERKAAEIERERLLAELEKRALQLQTATEVSRAAGSILDPDELIQQVVNLVRERFNLYYAGLFLVDQTGESGKWAVLRAGTGRAGQRMVEQSYKLEIGGASIISWCVTNKQARIASDVGQEAVHFDNPLLPETRSEMGLPLISQGRVIGAMTIQSNQPAAFTQEDITILQTMADQLSNAIENVSLLAKHKQAEEALAQEQYLMQALMDNTPDHIYFKDRASRFIRTSKSQAQAFGLSDPAQTLGKTDFDFFTEEHARPAYKDEQRILQTGQPLMNVEERETWPDHPDTWASTTKMPLRDKRGQIVGTFGISRDITERKRSEAERERLLIDLARRALQLQTAAEVSRAASSILNVDELLPQVVELIRTRFDLYYVGLFLVDEAQQTAMLRAGTGEEGRQMLKAGHKHQVGGASMIGWSIANQKARIALDVGEEAVRFSNPLLPKTRSEMALPLISRGRVLGAMTIQSDQPAAFTQEDITALQTMTDQLANAIENAYLYQDTQRRADEMAVLNEMSRVLSSRLDVNAVIKSIREYASRLMDVTNFYIALYDEQWNEVSFPLFIDGDQPVQAPSRRDGQGMTEYLIQTRQPLLVEENVTEWMEQHSIPVIGQTALSWLGVPMVIGDRVVGAIAVQSYTTPRTYNPRHRDLLTLIANQAAIALDNARLFEGAHTRAEELAVLNQVSQGLVSILDVDQVLTTLLDEVPHLLSGVSSSVWLTDLATGELVCRHAVGIQSETLRGQRIAPGEGLSGWVVTHGESVIVPDIKSDARHFAGVDQQSGLMVRAFLSVPLKVNENVIGVLNAADTTVNRFSVTDQTLLELLAASGAIAIQNARLFSERKQAEEALAYEQFLMRTLMDNIPDYIYFKDRASRFIRLSKAHVQSFGKNRPDEVVGKTDFDFFTDEHAKAAYEDEQNIIRTGQPVMDKEEEATWLDRPSTWVLTTKMPLHDEKGQIIGTFGISKDITERKWAEAERERLLAETEALYQASAAIKEAQTYDEVLTALRQHTLLGKADVGASINLFDQPWTRDQEPKWAYVPARWSMLPTENLPKRHLLNESFKRLWRPDAPTIVQDIEHDQRLDEQVRVPFSQDYHGGSLIYAPMVAGGQWIGNFYAIWSRPNQFAEADVRRMMNLVGQAATAVENIRRLEETQNRARREQMLNEVANRIRAGLTLEQVLNATVQEVGTALGAARVAVRLEPIVGDPEGAFGSGSGNGRR